jgi:hypothetical protein
MRFCCHHKHSNCCRAALTRFRNFRSRHFPHHCRQIWVPPGSRRQSQAEPGSRRQPSGSLFAPQSIPTGCWPSEAFYIARHFLEFIEGQAIQRAFRQHKFIGSVCCHRDTYVRQVYDCAIGATLEKLGQVRDRWSAWVSTIDGFSDVSLERGCDCAAGRRLSSVAIGKGEGQAFEMRSR